MYGRHFNQLAGLGRPGFDVASRNGLQHAQTAALLELGTAPSATLIKDLYAKPANRLFQS